jgi:YVTN family beta-propeller protein
MYWTPRLLIATTALVFVTIAVSAGAPDKAEAAESLHAGYQVAKTWPIGGEGRWDYITCDSASRRLYVTRQSHVQVIDETSGEVVADLKDTPGCHGVAIAPDLGRGFVSNGKGDSVTVFDLKTNHAMGTVPVGQNPDAILYDRGSKKVFAFNGKSHDATVIDAAAEPGPAAVVGRIQLDGKPEFAVSDEAGHVYVNLEDKNAVAVVDPKEMKVIAVWKIEGGEEPSGLAIDLAHHRLFAGCSNDVMAILDSQSGKTVATVPIGKGVDACGFDPGTNEAFASCGDGTLTVIDGDAGTHYSVKQTVKTPHGARTMVLDPATHTIYLPTSEFLDAPPGGGKRPVSKPGSFMVVVVAPIKE